MVVKVTIVLVVVVGALTPKSLLVYLLLQRDLETKKNKLRLMAAENKRMADEKERIVVSRNY